MRLKGEREKTVRNLDFRFFIAYFALHKMRNANRAICNHLFNNEMMKELNNPFVIYGYKGEAYFCDRESETEKMLDALANERNITLVAPRRMGKTGLIHHVFNRLDTGETKCFYVDIYATKSLNDFAAALAGKVIGGLDTLQEATWRKIQNFFGNFRPTLSYDQLTGAPVVSLDIAHGSEEPSIKQTFDYIAQSGKRCYIAIDEFQQILEYPESNVESLLRTFIQFMPNTYFIFAGSRRHVLQQMFTKANRPFFQSSQLMSLGPISEEKYLAWASAFFAQRGQQLPPALFHSIYERTGGTTWHINVVLNRLYSRKPQEITANLLEDVVNEIIEEQTFAYENVAHDLSRNEFNVLRAIAIDGVVTSPTSARFIARHKLTATSSVKTALRKLDAQQLVEQNIATGGYYLHDPFMALWLRRL